MDLDKLFIKRDVDFDLYEVDLDKASDEELVEITSYIERYFTENMINVPILYNGNWFVYNTSRFTGWSTAEDPYCQPALSVHDMKVYHLMNLEPVQ